MGVNEINMIARDPNKINGHIKVLYPDILGEPEETSHSVNCIWKNSHGCYNCGKNCCYKFITCLFSIPTALFWGCGFGILVFYQVWIIIPLMKLQNITFNVIRKYLRLMIGMFLGPFFETAALLFSRIYIVNSKAPPPPPFMEKLFTYEHIELTQGIGKSYNQTNASTNKFTGPGNKIKPYR